MTTFPVSVNGENGRRSITFGLETPTPLRKGNDYGHPLDELPILYDPEVGPFLEKSLKSVDVVGLTETPSQQLAHILPIYAAQEWEDAIDAPDALGIHKLDSGLPQWIMDEGELDGAPLEQHREGMLDTLALSVALEERKSGRVVDTDRFDRSFGLLQIIDSMYIQQGDDHASMFFGSEEISETTIAERIHPILDSIDDVGNIESLADEGVISLGGARDAHQAVQKHTLHRYSFFREVNRYKKLNQDIARARQSARISYTERQVDAMRTHQLRRVSFALRVLRQHAVISTLGKDNSSLHAADRLSRNVINLRRAMGISSDAYELDAEKISGIANEMYIQGNERRFTQFDQMVQLAFPGASTVGRAGLEYADILVPPDTGQHQTHPETLTFADIAFIAYRSAYRANLEQLFGQYGAVLPLTDVGAQKVCEDLGILFHFEPQGHIQFDENVFAQVIGNALRLADEMETVSPTELDKYPYWSSVARAVVGRIQHSLHTLTTSGKSAILDLYTKNPDALVSLGSWYEIAEIKALLYGNGLSDTEKPEQTGSIPTIEDMRRIFENDFDDSPDVAERSALFLLQLAHRRENRKRNISLKGFGESVDNLAAMHGQILGRSGVGKSDGVFKKMAEFLGFDIFKRDAGQFTITGIEGTHKEEYIYMMVDEIWRKHPDWSIDNVKDYINSGYVIMVLDEAHKLYEGSLNDSGSGTRAITPAEYQSELNGMVDGNDHFVTPVRPDRAGRMDERTSAITSLAINTKNIPVIITRSLQQRDTRGILGYFYAHGGSRSITNAWEIIGGIPGTEIGKSVGFLPDTASRFSTVITPVAPTYVSMLENWNGSLDTNPRCARALAARELAFKTGIHPNRIRFTDDAAQIVASYAMQRNNGWRGFHEVRNLIVRNIDLGSSVQPADMYLITGQMIEDAIRQN